MKYVLFVCTHDAGRSQMAQALFERYAPEDVRSESAGSDPARELWPEVIEVMREVDIDLSGRKPKRLSVTRSGSTLRRTSGGSRSCSRS